MIILASASKRRIELLNDSGLKFKVIPSDVSEHINDNLEPEQNAMNISLAKAVSVADKNPTDIVIAADTMVVLNNRVFGKPKDEAEAFEMLKTLSNRKHRVITGVTIIHDGIEDVFYSETIVKMKDLSDEEINDYISLGESFDKAGGYGIQGAGKDLVETFEGDFLTVVGLPLKEVLKRIKEIESKN